MPWSAQFIDDLGKPALTPMWRLRWYKVGTAAGTAWSTLSHGGSPRIRRVRIDGHALNDYACASTWGRTLIEVVGNDLGDLGECVPRGSFMALYLGFEGYAEADFQRVAFGQLRQVRGRAPVWTIELVDAPTGLRQRPTNTVTEIEAFYDIDPDESVTLTADYTPGDATVTVTSTTGFSKSTADPGAILVTPTTGDPFYLSYTGVTATTFTGVAASAVAGTTAVAAVSGDRVDRVAYLTGRPITIALEVLCSSYGGANGTYDVLPVQWGLQVYSDLVDAVDARWYRDNVMVLGSGTYVWDVMVTTSQPDALGWLQGVLAAGGMYLTMRQGCLTVRAQQQSIAPIAVAEDWSITDADIVDIVEHQWWDAEHQEECASVTATTSGGSTSVTKAAVYQRPAAVTAVFDVSEYVHANTTEIRTEMTNRLAECKTATPERIRLKLRGWTWAQMTPGDLGRLTTNRTPSRVSEGGVFDARRVKIVQVSPMWDTEPVTEVSVLVYPPRAHTWA